MTILTINGITVDMAADQLTLSFTIDNQAPIIAVSQEITDFYLSEAQYTTSEDISDNALFSKYNMVLGTDYTVDVHDDNGNIGTENDGVSHFATYTYTVSLAEIGVPMVVDGTEISVRATIQNLNGVDSSATNWADQGAVFDAFDSSDDQGASYSAPSSTTFTSVIGRVMVGGGAVEPRFPTEIKPQEGDILTLGSINIVGDTNINIGKRIPFFTVIDETTPNADDASLSANPATLDLGDGRFIYDRSSEETSITDGKVTLTAPDLDLASDATLDLVSSNVAEDASLTLTADQLVAQAIKSIALSTAEGVAADGADGSSISMDVAGVDSFILIANSQLSLKQDVALQEFNTDMLVIDGAGETGEHGDGERDGEILISVNISNLALLVPDQSPAGHDLDSSGPVLSYAGQLTHSVYGSLWSFSAQGDNGDPDAVSYDFRQLLEAAASERSLDLTFSYLDGYSIALTVDLCDLVIDGTASMDSETEAVRKSIALKAPTTSVAGDFIVSLPDADPSERLIEVLARKDEDDNEKSSLKFASGFLHIENNDEENSILVGDAYSPMFKVDAAENTSSNGYIEMNAGVDATFAQSKMLPTGPDGSDVLYTIQDVVISAQPAEGIATMSYPDYRFVAAYDYRRLMELEPSDRLIELTATYVDSSANTDTQTESVDLGIMAQSDFSIVAFQEFAKTAEIALSNVEQILLESAYIDLRASMHMQGDLRVESDDFISMRASNAVNLHSDSQMILNAPGFQVLSHSTEAKLRVGDFTSTLESGYDKLFLLGESGKSIVTAQEITAGTNLRAIEDVQANRHLYGVWNSDTQQANFRVKAEWDAAIGANDAKMFFDGIDVDYNLSNRMQIDGKLEVIGWLKAGHSLTVREDEGGTGDHGFYVPLAIQQGPQSQDENGNPLFDDGTGTLTTDADNGESGENLVTYSPVYDPAPLLEDVQNDMLSTRGLKLGGSLQVGTGPFQVRQPGWGGNAAAMAIVDLLGDLNITGESDFVGATRQDGDFSVANGDAWIKDNLESGTDTHALRVNQLTIIEVAAAQDAETIASSTLEPGVPLMLSSSPAVGAVTLNIPSDGSWEYTINSDDLFGQVLSDRQFTIITDQGGPLEQSTTIDPAQYIVSTQSASSSVMGQSPAASSANRIESTRGLNLGGGLAVGGSVTIGGNFTVSGTTTTVHSSEVAIEDNLIVLANVADGQSADVLHAGIRVDQINGAADKGVFWHKDDAYTGGGYWEFAEMDSEEGTFSHSFLEVKADRLHGNVTGDVTGRISNISDKLTSTEGVVDRHDTSELDEDPGASVTSGTMYFTAARVHDAVAADGNAIVSAVADNVETFSLAIDGYTAADGETPESGTQIPLANGVDGLYASYSLTVSSADAPEGYTVDAADFGSLAYAPSTGALTAVLPTNHDVWGTFSATEVDAGDDTPHGGLAFSEGDISLTRVTDRMIRGDVTGRNTIQYAGADAQVEVTQSAEADGKLALNPGQFGLYIDTDSTAPLTDGANGLKALASGSGSIQYGGKDAQTAEAQSEGVDGKLELAIGQFGLYVDADNTFKMSDADAGLKALMSAGDATELEKTYGSLAFAVTDDVNTNTLTRVKATEVHADILVEDTHKDGGLVDENGAPTGVAQVFAGTADDNSIRVAVLEKVLDTTQGAETLTNQLKSFDVGDIRAMFGVTNSDDQADSALGYDAATGVFSWDGSLGDDITVGSLTAGKLIDDALDMAASADIALHALVDCTGKPALAKLNDWMLAGQALEAVLLGESLKGKLHMMPKRAVIEVNAEANSNALADGDIVFLSPNEGGCVTTVMPSADGDAVVMIGRMKMMDGSLMCILADQFLFDA